MVFQDLNIVAKPPGARIMIGDDNIGRAPLTIRYRRGGDQGQAKTVTIRAMANGAGECNQRTKSLSGTAQESTIRP